MNDRKKLKFHKTRYRHPTIFIVNEIPYIPTRTNSNQNSKSASILCQKSEKSL